MFDQVVKDNGKSMTLLDHILDDQYNFAANYLLWVKQWKLKYSSKVKYSWWKYHNESSTNKTDTGI